MKFAKFAVCAAMALSSVGAWASYFEFGSQMGCGVIVTVRETYQAPLYDDFYEASNTRSSGQGFSLLAGFGVVSQAAAVVTGLAADTVNARDRDAPKVENFDRRQIRAVGIELDDGRKINVPLFEPEKYAVTDQRFRVGDRVKLSYSKKLDNIQVVVDNRNLAPVGDTTSKRFKVLCGFRADRTVADDIISRSENLVDESQIVH